MTKIYTRAGDRGETGLLGGSRVSKAHPRVAAYGSVDELNAALGLALAMDDEGWLDRERLTEVQEDLLVVGARLAAVDPEAADRRGLIPALAVDRVEGLERWIDELQEDLPPLDAFVLPGGAPLGAQLHFARTVCRRAERELTAAMDSVPGEGARLLPYLNRLSDVLFVLARSVNRAAGRPERRWMTRRERREDGPNETREGDE